MSAPRSIAGLFLYSKSPPNPLLEKEGENILGKSPLYRRGDLGVIYSTEKEKYKTPKGVFPTKSCQSFWHAIILQILSPRRNAGLFLYFLICPPSSEVVDRSEIGLSYWIHNRAGLKPHAIQGIVPSGLSFHVRRTYPCLG